MKLKIEANLDDLLPEHIFHLANALSEQKDSAFSELVTFLGLDPTCDLKHSDLSYIDLSHSDIRGYDFTGCLLRGATGINVCIDASTNLAGADITDSLFAYEVGKNAFFKANPNLAERVELLANDYWANTIVRVADLLRSKADRAVALQIARAVFEEAKDPTVRSDILSHMVRVTDRQDHKVFIYHLLARGADEVNFLRPALNSLKSYYADDLDAFNVMLNFLSYNDKQIQSFALSGLIISRHFFSAFAKIRDHIISSHNPMMRRTLVGRVARKELKNASQLLEDVEVANYIDFGERISLEKLKAMSKRSFARVTASGMEQIEEQLKFRDTHPNGKNVEARRASIIQSVILAIRDKYGLPFDAYDGRIA